MKLWAVLEIDSWAYVGIFSSREKAEQYITQQFIKWTLPVVPENLGYHIEETQLDYLLKE